MDTGGQTSQYNPMTYGQDEAGAEGKEGEEGSSLPVRNVV